MPKDKSVILTPLLYIAVMEYSMFRLYENTGPRRRYVMDT